MIIYKIFQLKIFLSHIAIKISKKNFGGDINSTYLQKYDSRLINFTFKIWQICIDYIERKFVLRICALRI